MAIPCTNNLYSVVQGESFEEPEYLEQCAQCITCQVYVCTYVHMCASEAVLWDLWPHCLLWVHALSFGCCSPQRQTFPSVL